MENVEKTKLLPIILQHVRELAELHTGLAGNQHFKIITPFPPVFNDFPSFQKEQLEFRDPQTDGLAAQADTFAALDFYRATDYLYYDYSYGIKLEVPTLSNVCQEFFLNTRAVDTEDINFTTSFDKTEDAFLRKSHRQTVPQEIDFIFTSYSPIQWDDNKVVITYETFNRLKEKTLSVYKDVGSNNDYIKSLITQIQGAFYQEIKYEFGFFDVVRQWVDPTLFESRNWEFKPGVGNNVLYGANDPTFEADDVKLCYAQRFYVIKNYSGTPPVPIPWNFSVGDVFGISNSPNNFQLNQDFPVINLTNANFELNQGGTVGVSSSALQLPDHRTELRNKLLDKKLASIQATIIPTTTAANSSTAFTTQPSQPSAHPGFVFVEATDTVPGHWEGVHAHPHQPAATTGGNVAETTDTTVNDSAYKVAAILCRVIPRKPVTE